MISTPWYFSSGLIAKEFFERGVSLGFFSGTVTKRFDDTNLYRCLYDDGDVEDYTIDELCELLGLQVADTDKVKQAHDDVVTVVNQHKIRRGGLRDEYLFREKLKLKEKEWFGATLADRRKLCCSIMNFCIFNHPMGACTCDSGVNPWLQSTQTKPCVFRHTPETCKCNLPAIKFSQDECAYAAYLLSKRECVALQKQGATTQEIRWSG